VFRRTFLFLLLLLRYSRASEDHVTASMMIQRYDIILSAVRASYCFGTPMSLGHASGLGKHVFWVVQRDARQMLAGILVTGVGASPVRLTRVAGQSTKQWAHTSALCARQIYYYLGTSPHARIFIRRRLVLRSPLRSPSSRLPTLASLPSSSLVNNTDPLTRSARLYIPYILYPD
jgi:hypothetical protein